MDKIELGIDKDGKTVEVPIFHTFISGQTHYSGKTTTLITMARRALKHGYTILVFDTKENVRDYEGFHEIPIYFKWINDSIALKAVLENSHPEFGKLNKQFATLDRQVGGEDSAQDIMRKLQEVEKTTKVGIIKDMARTLWRLLQELIDELQHIHHTDKFTLKDNTINVMPLNDISESLQQLIVKSCFKRVMKDYNKKTIVIIDEAWKFIPQDRTSACIDELNSIIRQGAKSKLFIWIGTQFLTVTNKGPLKACALKLLGTQDQKNEVDDTLAYLPSKIFTRDDIMALKQGEFIVGSKEPQYVKKLYVKIEGTIKQTAKTLPLKVPVKPAFKVKPEEEQAPKKMLADSKYSEEDFRKFEDMWLHDERIEKKMQAYIQEIIHKLPEPLIAGKSVPVTTVEVTENIPLLIINKKLNKVEMDNSTARGECYLLITEGFFDNAQTVPNVDKELRRRGKGTSPKRIYEYLDEACSQGFLWKTTDPVSYVIVDNCKDRIKINEVVE